MTVSKPRRRVCPGQSVRFPVTAHDPVVWLRGGVPAGVVAFEVDGYIINRESRVNGVFNKYAFDDGGLGATADRIRDALARNGHLGEIAACKGFAERLHSPYRVFAWPQNFPNDARDLTRAGIYAFEPVLRGGASDLGQCRMATLDDLAAGFRMLRGRSFGSVKPVSSATSAVECYLANQTSDPWPGDLDAVLAKADDGEILALVEFKTHNRDTPIELERLGRYGRQDWRRFEVLFRLQDQLERAQGIRPALFYVAWGTGASDHHRRIKIDQLVGAEVVETRLMERPAFGTGSSALVEALVG